MRYVQYLIPAVVFLLMVSVGLSLRLREVRSRWSRLNWLNWLCLLLASFILPAALALLFSGIFHLSMGETAGLFMVGVAPGAPLLTRNLARKGFDMHMAASYQLWAALMVPLMIPLLVFVAGKLYDRDIWIPPLMLLKQIGLKQLLPLTVGMVISWVAPKISQKAQPVLNVAGNVLLTISIVLILLKLGPALKAITPLVPVAALLLAVGSLAGILLLPIRDELVRKTFAICNVNRHAGLALLLSGQYVQARDALPTVACYALVAPLFMIAYAKYYSSQGKIVDIRSGSSS